MTDKRFMIDDAGTLIDIETRDTFDYVSDVCGLLNKLHMQNNGLKSSNMEYEDELGRMEEENKQLKLLIKALKKSNADYIHQIKKAYEEDLSIKELADNCGVDLEVEEIQEGA